MHGRNGDFAVQDPLVLGHESSGIVTALGPQVSGLRIGQRVAIECGVMCSNCDYCSKGRYNLCKGMRFCSSAKTYPHLDGTLQGRLNHPSHLLHPYVFVLTFVTHTTKFILSRLPTLQHSRQCLIRSSRTRRTSFSPNSRFSSRRPPRGSNSSRIRRRFNRSPRMLTRPLKQSQTSRRTRHQPTTTRVREEGRVRGHDVLPAITG